MHLFAAQLLRVSSFFPRTYTVANLSSLFPYNPLLPKKIRMGLATQVLLWLHIRDNEVTCIGKK